MLHTDVVQADVLADERRDSGATVHRLECTAPLSATSTMILGCEARLMRAVTHRPQLLFVCGPGQYLPNPDTIDGFDEILMVTTDNETLEDDPADEVDAVLAVETPITVAGVTVADPAARVLRYLYDHARTVRRYDMTAGHYEAVTQELIAATRVLASRISDNQATWLIDRAKTAPWDLVPRHSDLANADPCQRHGLYDHASELFAHFRSAAPKGIKAAKIYKVLHLMRPELFPILDSRLAARYDLSAKQAAHAVNVCRDDLPTSKYAYWAAIRQDLLNNTSALAAVRDSLTATDDPFIVEAIGRLSDVRILDIITWVAADNDSTPSPEDL